MKEIKIQNHGNYLYGTLEGVDFVASGTLENGKIYGSSVKLRFVTKIEKIRNVNGMDISTLNSVTQIIRIACADKDLASEVKKYNALISKDLLISYSVADNNTFVATDSTVSVVSDIKLA